MGNIGSTNPANVVRAKASRAARTLTLILRPSLPTHVLLAEVLLA